MSDQIEREPPLSDKKPPSRVARGIVLAAYKQMLITVLASLSILIILLIAMFFYSGNKSDPAPSIFLSVIVCGILGAMFSAATRLYTFKDLPLVVVDPSKSGLGRFYLFAYSMLPPFIGAIAAAVIYIVFLSGLIVGPLFPKFDCHSGKVCRTFADLIWEFGPDSVTDFAKCLIWGFIAGFAERLVPDALQRLADKANHLDEG